MKRKKHAAGWAGVTNSCKSRTQAATKFKFNLGRIKMSIDRQEIDIDTLSARNCLEEMGLLALQMKEYFKTGSGESLNPEISKFDKEEVPWGEISSCKEGDPIDLNNDQIVPDGFRSTPDEIGNISLSMVHSKPISMQSDDWSYFMESLSIQLFELEQAVRQNREPKIVLDLFPFSDYYVETSPKGKYEQKDLKHVLNLSEKEYQLNLLWIDYKQALHEINLLTQEIQKLLTRRNCTTTKMKSSHRSHSRNMTPNGMDEILSNLFSFLGRKTKPRRN